ncbi:hypothetical protein E2C01_092794 [Portunus trituberculatus]|uniref:Uncharacterized protein n=1 Tax=Portunus trituberculatus TaxID=210409 RepID=A0A5B7JT63_PORTR|nr:hypothetical protein [Portunus trituberculatus]
MSRHPNPAPRTRRVRRAKQDTLIIHISKKKITSGTTAV